ncbi:hypothetical protein MPSYJ_19840 [Mycolicibacterium psychrotolerans]|uniref:Uncharacterized protein n=2 Tax=Mycolicibacterium psychrotolerans TaxID=216929 RepID=A0A7I7MAL1_9MYCO|nr:hypothetical protein MPSYJ_19840 [Mycolicibacterium psychrotolerans]
MLVCALALSGCGGTADSRADTTTPAPSSSAAALPPGFPDLSMLTPVDTKQFFQSYPYFRGVQFRTPDGQECYSNDMNSLDDSAIRTLTCEGPRPDKGPGTWEIDVATDQPATIEPSASPLNPTDTPDPSTEAALLPALRRIDHEGIECGVDDEGTTACRVGEHGFVLTSTATTLF